MIICQINILRSFIHPKRNMNDCFSLDIQILGMLLFFTSITVCKAQKDSINFSSAVWEVQEIQNSGIQHYHHHFTDDSLFGALQNIHFIKVKKEVAKQALAVLRAGPGKQTTSALALENKALAAINGSFFNVAQGHSVNFIKMDGIIMDTTVYDQKQKNLKVAQEGVIAFGTEGVSIVPRKFGERSTWPEGTGFTSAMEAGPILMLDGEEKKLADTPFNSNRHPRTCVCLTEEEVILLTADGRSPQAYGLSLPELTLVLKWLGCKSALNLDGGGSTTMYIMGKGVVNMPSDNKQWDHEGERAVSNALAIMPFDP